MVSGLRNKCLIVTHKQHETSLEIVQKQCHKLTEGPLKASFSVGPLSPLKMKLMAAESQALGKPIEKE